MGKIGKSDSGMSHIKCKCLPRDDTMGSVTCGRGKLNGPADGGGMKGACL